MDYRKLIVYVFKFVADGKTTPSRDQAHKHVGKYQSNPGNDQPVDLVHRLCQKSLKPYKLWHESLTLEKLRICSKFSLSQKEPRSNNYIISKNNYF